MDEAYIAICPEFNGLSGIGETPEQAIAEFYVGLDLTLAVYDDEGWELPR